MPQVETKRPLQELVETSSCEVLIDNKSTTNKFISQPGNQLTGQPVNQITSHPANQLTSWSGNCWFLLPRGGLPVNMDFMLN